MGDDVRSPDDAALARERLLALLEAEHPGAAWTLIPQPFLVDGVEVEVWNLAWSAGPALSELLARFDGRRWTEQHGLYGSPVCSLQPDGCVRIELRPHRAISRGERLAAAAADLGSVEPDEDALWSGGMGDLEARWDEQRAELWTDAWQSLESYGVRARMMLPADHARWLRETHPFVERFADAGVFAEPVGPGPTAGWTYAGWGAPVRPLELHGVDVLATPWRSRLERVVVVHPDWDPTPRRAFVYELEGVDPPVAFAALRYDDSAAQVHVFVPEGASEA
ncbi:MAG: hypothetical protein U0R76_17245 [Candidatus Nanopelagicales bacterium]